MSATGAAAGRPPAGLTGPAGKGTRVRADKRGIASEGSVTVIDLAPAIRKPPASHPGDCPRAARLRAGAFAQWTLAGGGQRRQRLFECVDTRNDEVAESICARQKPG